MAQPSGLPTAIDKRNMLHAPDPRRPFDPLQVGESFEKLGRFTEALDFFERITDEGLRKDRVDRVRRAAVESGNAFILTRVANKGFAPVSKDDWKNVAAKAKAAGMLRHALRAAIQAGDEALTTEMRTALGDAVPAALAAQAESPEQAKAGATIPGHKVEAVAAAGAAHQHEPAPAAPEGDKPKA
jgi:hypothetical protein